MIWYIVQDLSYNFWWYTSNNFWIVIWINQQIIQFIISAQLINIFLFIAAQYTRDGGKKVAVPKISEKPIMGLVSDKNFIVSNAVENILAAPKLPGNSNKDYLKKKNYGKVPKYLQTIKKEIEDEYQLVREM